MSKKALFASVTVDGSVVGLSAFASLGVERLSHRVAWIPVDTTTADRYMLTFAVQATDRP